MLVEIRVPDAAILPAAQRTAALARRYLADTCPLEHTVQFLTRLATFAPDLRDWAAKLLSRPRWR